MPARSKPSHSIEMPTKTYPSEGRCIFCLTTLAPADLTDEHVVPRMISGAGEVVIAKGSCRRCQAHANDWYEQPVANANLLVPRLLLGLKRRKARKQPKHLPPVALHAELGAAEADFATRLESGEYPPIVQFLLFRPPGRLTGDERGSDLTAVRFSFVHLGLGGGSRLPDATVPSVVTRHGVLHTQFALYLAKMAYCHAVGTLRLSGFDGGDIRDLLCGRRGDVYNFVGGPIVEERLSGRHLHGLYLRYRSGGWLSVVIRLFASFNGPTYEVVVAPWPSRRAASALVG